MENIQDKRSFRARQEHKEMILEEAEKNPVIVTMNFSTPNARAHYNKSWELLTISLNSLGYGEKSTDKWRRVSVDWIFTVKSKYSKIKKEMAKTGGGPFNNIHLSSQEERLLAIKGLTSVEGDGETIEMGISGVSTQPTEMNSVEIEHHPLDHTYFHSDNITANVTEEIDQEVINSVEEDVPKKKRQKLSVSSNTSKSLQEMHTETLEQLKNISDSLLVIADSLKLISNGLKRGHSSDT